MLTTPARITATIAASLCALKVTAPSRGLSQSLPGRGAMCQVWPPEQLAFAWQTRGCATALTISWEEAQHARLRRACAAPQWAWSAHAV